MSISWSRLMPNLSIVMAVVLTWQLFDEGELAPLIPVQAFATSNNRRRSGTVVRHTKGTGLGLEQPKHPLKHAKSQAKEKKNEIYSKPSLYDLAFGYRNFEEEISFLLQAHQTHSFSGQLPTNVLELAAGPARHSLTALTFGGSLSIKHATAVDISEDMKEYALDLARSHYNQQPTDRPPFLILDDVSEAEQSLAPVFEYILQDMRNLQLPSESFDSAWILLGSMQHLLTNDDVIKCFRSLHNVLSLDGTVVVELPHPQETFTMVECTQNTWSVPLDVSDGTNGILKVQWGGENDAFDPIRQVRDLTVKLELMASDRKREEPLACVSQVVPTRLFTAQELNALAYCSGFEVAAMYGALDEAVDVNETEQAYRMVCVLRKMKQV